MIGTLELAVFNAASVQVAFDCSVDRIELCSNYSVGGVTPLFSEFINARKVFKKNIFVMIRSRPGDFVFSDIEFSEMMEAMASFKLAGADGFVAGFLNADKTVNKLQTKMFVDACAPLPVTFHRAIDACENYFEAVSHVVDCGVKRILSTGTALSAFEGKVMLNVIQQKYFDRLIVVAGGNVRSQGLSTFLTDGSVTEIHSAAITMKGSDVADAVEVNNLIRLLKK